METRDRIVNLALLAAAGLAWIRAARRGAWIGLFVSVIVVLRLVDAFQLPIILFLAAIFVVAEVTLSAER